MAYLIEEKVVSIVKNNIDYNISQNRGLDCKLKDLGADSLDIIGIAMSLDKEFNITIPDDVVYSWKTTRDIILSVKKLVN